MNKITKNFAIGVASLSLVATLGAAPAFATTESNRLGGETRFDTAREAFPYARHTEDGTAYVANYAGIPDAITAGSLDGGILYGSGTYLLGGTVQKVTDNKKTFGDPIVNKHGVKKFTFLGGNGVWATDVPQRITAKDGDLATVDGVSGLKGSQISGADRYETAAKIFEEWVARHGKQAGNIEVLIANGGTIVDALAGGSLDAPILLVRPDGTVPQATVNILKKYNISRVTILGGTGAVSEFTANEVASYAGTVATSTDKGTPSASTPASEYKKWKDRLDYYNKLLEKGGQLETQIKNSESLLQTAKTQADDATKEVELKLRQLNLALGTAPSGGWTAEKAWVKEAPVIQDVLTTLKNSGLYGFGIDIPLTQESAGTLLKFGDTVQLNTEALNRVYNADQFRTFTTEFNTWKDKGTAPTADSLAGVVVNGLLNNNKFSLTLAKDAYQARLDWAKDNQKAFKEAVNTITKWLKANEANKNGALSTTEKKSATVKLDRIAGADRYETAVKIAEARLNKTHGYNTSDIEHVYLVNGTALADAAVAGSLDKGVVLLTNWASLPTSTSYAIGKLKELSGTKTDVKAIGGTGVVSDAVLLEATVNYGGN